MSDALHCIKYSFFIPQTLYSNIKIADAVGCYNTQLNLAEEFLSMKLQLTYKQHP